MAVDDGERLGKGNLSLKDVVAQSVGYMGPVFSGTFFIPTIVGFSVTGRGAGIASPFAILLTAIGMLGLAWIISRYAKRIHAAGALYDYISEGFGRPFGLLGGLGLLRRGADAHARDRPRLRRLPERRARLRARHRHQLDLVHAARSGSSPGSCRCSASSSRRARSSRSRSSRSPSSSHGPIYVILKGGSNGFSLRPFNPGESSFTGITYGIVYAGLIFVGFESAANLAEETAEPKRNIPRAIFYSVIAAGIFYVVLAWALLLAFGLNVGDLLKNFPPLYAATSNPDFGGQRFGELDPVARRDRHRGGGAGHGHVDDARSVRARARPPSATPARRGAPALQDAVCRGHRDRDHGDRRRDHRPA